MATNILLLPNVQFVAQTDTNGDWLDAIAFVNNGSPIDISGIAFVITWRLASANPQAPVMQALRAMTALGTLLNGGPSGVLSAAVPAAQLPQPAAYVADILAIADGHTRNLSEAGLSQITHVQGIS